MPRSRQAEVWGRSTLTRTLMSARRPPGRPAATCIPLQHNQLRSPPPHRLVCETRGPQLFLPRSRLSRPLQPFR